MRFRLCSLALCSLVLAATARADIAPPRWWVSLAVQSVRAVGGEVPREDRSRAVEQVGAELQGFVDRVERCIRDHDPAWRIGGPGTRGVVRARLHYARAELPTRTSVVDASLGRPAGTCVAEVLPSIAVRPAIRGELTIEVVLTSRRVSGWGTPPRRGR